MDCLGIVLCNENRSWKYKIGEKNNFWYYTDWFIGILVTAYYSSYIPGKYTPLLYSNSSRCLVIAHRSTKKNTRPCGWLWLWGLGYRKEHEIDGWRLILRKFLRKNLEQTPHVPQNQAKKMISYKKNRCSRVPGYVPGVCWIVLEKLPRFIPKSCMLFIPNLAHLFNKNEKPGP